jgi:hypothetical protein
MRTPVIATPLLTSCRRMAMLSDFAPSPGAPAIEVTTETCILLSPAHLTQTDYGTQRRALCTICATRAVRLGKWLRCARSWVCVEDGDLFLANGKYFEPAVILLGDQCVHRSGNQCASRYPEPGCSPICQSAVVPCGPRGGHLARTTSPARLNVGATQGLARAC